MSGGSDSEASYFSCHDAEAQTSFPSLNETSLLHSADKGRRAVIESSDEEEDYISSDNVVDVSVAGSEDASHVVSPSVGRNDVSADLDARSDCTNDPSGAEGPSSSGDEGLAGVSSMPAEPISGESGLTAADVALFRSLYPDTPVHVGLRHAARFVFPDHDEPKLDLSSPSPAGGEGTSGDFETQNDLPKLDLTCPTSARDTEDSSDEDDFDKYIQRIKSSEKMSPMECVGSPEDSISKFVVPDGTCSDADSDADSDSGSDYEDDSSEDKDGSDSESPESEAEERTRFSPAKKPAAHKAGRSGDSDAWFLRSLNPSLPPDFRREPSADKFLRGFKRHREELTLRLFRIFNDRVFQGKLPASLEVSWNVRLRKTAGHCKTRRGDVPSAHIELSTKVTDRADRLRDTLVHELCHAAAWLVDGLWREGHGPAWKAWARRVTVVFPRMPPVARCHRYDIIAKYIYKCSGCAQSYKRHSKSIDVSRKVCGKCKGRLELHTANQNPNKENDASTVPHTPRTPSAFALFVKDNYREVKTAGVPHKEVMGILGQRFRSLKLHANSNT